MFRKSTVYKLIPMTTAVLLTGCGTLNNLIGDPLAPPEGAIETMRLHASGVQQFQCAIDSKGRYWRFISPKAKLYDNNGQLVAEQGADFSFSAPDGSHLTAKIRKSSPGKTENDLKGLLFRTHSHGKSGILTGITWIKRDNATGGIPLTTCSPSQVGMILKVHFTATYTFYR